MKQAHTTLTKADTVALWHAVDAYALQVSLMRSPPCDFTPEQFAAERDRVLAARRALRKVNQLRKATCEIAQVRKLPCNGGKDDR